jgi:hypothetical protein
MRLDVEAPAMFDATSAQLLHYVSELDGMLRASATGAVSQTALAQAVAALHDLDGLKSDAPGHPLVRALALQSVKVFVQRARMAVSQAKVVKTEHMRQSEIEDQLEKAMGDCNLAVLQPLIAELAALNPRSELISKADKYIAAKIDAYKLQFGNFWHIGGGGEGLIGKDWLCNVQDEGAMACAQQAQLLCEHTGQDMFALLSASTGGLPQVGPCNARTMQRIATTIIHMLAPTVKS